MSSEKIALTQTVQKGGCAAKVAASELRKILQRVQFPAAHPALMIDGGLFDDAAIYKVTEDIAMVQTLDFFTPIVDTPKLFGAIAAANALSDVYAMGGKPKTAMGILAFPIATMTDDVIVDVLQGASDKVAEAGANFVGGHSIDDDTLKFGLSVTGFVHPNHVWSNAGAQVGDHLILTKALGTGTMTAALKRQEASEADIMEALESMATVNNALDFMNEEQKKSVHAATDITGFGLSGHSMQLAKASQVTLKFQAQSLPKFAKALHFLEKGFLTKAHRSNAQYTENDIDVTALDNLHKLLIHDPQTSGGLLLSVPASLSADLVANLKKKFSFAAVVGEVLPKSDKAVIFE
ncbi:selenide, water dikinase SelD [Bdellovibrio sp. PAP01]|uniref:Selenide, water dikinase n=1 Tax=Bdellovibrio svalbardensis TaxID=2972972 RepID=A0ABT6DJJ9_9BACT|nr:selenide, water dikinase SelD [Bdellovibrio svalbardensis]MDG0816031.1 selenide, water dikinase SelD [Bdellovibrio svalbardensis]